MDRQVGRTVEDLVDGKQKRFVIISLGQHGLFGLYDAEVDDIVEESQLNMSLSKDSNEMIEQIIKQGEKFGNKIEELTKEK